MAMYSYIHPMLAYDFKEALEFHANFGEKITNCPTH